MIARTDAPVFQPAETATHLPAAIPTFRSERLGPVAFPAHRAGADPAAEEMRAFLLSLGRGFGLLAHGAGAGQPDLPDADEALRQALGSLDCVWLGPAGEMVAAFTVEGGDADGAAPLGPGKMADLLALQPRSKADLYLVAGGDWRDALARELNRPAYRGLKKPLAGACGFLPWERLRAEVDQIGARVRYMKPEFLGALAENLDLAAEGGAEPA